MALPQKVLEQLGREPPKTPGWSSQLLMFSSTIFFIALAVYLGLTYGYRPYLSSRVDKLQSDIQSFAQQVPLDQQAKIINFYSQIVNLKSILANHVYLPNVFNWLEKNTQTNVFFTQFTLAGNTKTVSLLGSAKSVDDIAQQLEIFQEQPEVLRASLLNTGTQNGLWQFSITLQLDPALFSNRQVQAAPTQPTHP